MGGPSKTTNSQTKCALLWTAPTLCRFYFLLFSRFIPSFWSISCSNFLRNLTFYLFFNLLIHLTNNFSEPKTHGVNLL
jgi:hypothetical protein